LNNRNTTGPSAMATIWRKRVISQIKSEPLDTFAAARAIMVAIADSYLLYRMFTRKTDFSFAAVQWADGEYRLGAEQIEIMERNRRSAVGTPGIRDE
jgi:hypothetical protein